MSLFKNLIEVSTNGRYMTLDEVEREHIAIVLEAHGGNKQVTARVLGIDRRTLYRKLARYRDKVKT